MKKNIFVISTIFLGIVVVALQQLLFSQKILTYVITKLIKLRYYNNVVMYADDPVYKALDRSNTKIQVNMNK